MSPTGTRTNAKQPFDRCDAPVELAGRVDEVVYAGEKRRRRHVILDIVRHIDDLAYTVGRSMADASRGRL
jgi:hypothetical protein